MNEQSSLLSQGRLFLYSFLFFPFQQSYYRRVVKSYLTAGSLCAAPSIQTSAVGNFADNLNLNVMISPLMLRPTFRHSSGQQTPAERSQEMTVAQRHES